MKKIAVVFFILFLFSIYSVLFPNENNIKESDKKKIIKNVRKNNFVYYTNNSDNINELLRKNKIEEKVDVVEEEQIEVISEEIIKNGFIVEGDNTYYYEDNNVVKGEREIDNDNYYFDDNGILQRNVFINKKYFGEDGKQIIGFYIIDEDTYYFDKEGFIVGKKEIDNDIYYFNDEGKLQKDKIIDNCYYDIEGKLFIGFKEIDNDTYYFTKEGFVHGIYDIEDKKFYFNDDGHLVRNTFYEDYYFDENGCSVIGNKEINGRIYVFNNEGKLINGFKEIDGKTYFLDENSERIKGLHIIDNVRYYFDFETGELIKKDVKSVIDISSWQGDIDFEKLKESNLIDGVIVRIGYGTTINDNPVLDNKFERNISELNRLNIPYGIYLYGYAQTEEAAIIEANFTYEMIKKYNVNLSYPIFYDAELNTFDGVKYTKNLYKKVINKYISVLNEYGYNDIGVYSNLNMFIKGGLTSLQKKIPKWIAQYYVRCQYEDNYVAWQYSSDGNIPGIEGRVDMNIFY